MTINYVREHELTELRDNLDAVVSIIDEICEPGDDLVWALSVTNKAANFVAKSLDHLKDGAGQ